MLFGSIGVLNGFSTYNGTIRMESHYKLKKICTSSSRQDIVTGPRLVKAYKQPEYWLKCMKQKLFSDMEEEIAQDC